MNAARKSEHDTPPRPRIYGGFEGHGLARTHRRARCAISCYPLVLLAAAF